MNPLARVRELIDSHHQATMFLAEVTSTPGGGAVGIQRVGQAAPDDQTYAHLATYSPIVGDRVLVVRVGVAGYVVIGDLA